MPITTQLSKQLGIRVPIVQGGMMWVGRPKLVAAVSNAGGLGILTGLTQPTPDALRKAIDEVRTMTDKPFGVNLTFLPSINPPDYMGYARAIIESGVKIVETAGSKDAFPAIEEFKKHGIYVIHKCTSIRHAISAGRKGADCISMDGLECAGHPGEDDIGGLVLLARAAQELKIPYLASGGFATGRGLAAALALGAQGINCGTLFMATTESEIHDKVKTEIVKADERQTTHIFRTLHNTARVYANGVAKQVVSIEKEKAKTGGAKFSDIQNLVAGAKGRKVFEDGDLEAGVWTAGPAVGLIKEVLTCEETIRRIEKEAEETITSMGRMKERESRL